MAVHIKKLPQYAESDIPECWLVNLKDNAIEVHWQPTGESYQFRELLRSGDMVKARGVELSIPAGAILR